MNPRIRSIILLLILTLWGAAAIRAAEPPTAAGEETLARAALSTQAPIWVGQQVVLQVDVLAADGWAQIKGTGDLSVEGAQVVRYESQGTRLNETIGGRAYTGQRYELSLFPGRAGIIRIPPLPIEVEITRWGNGGGKQSARLQTPEVTFEAQVPPGAEGFAELASTPRLTAEQSWASPESRFKVGDALQRSITLTAEALSGMALAPLEHAGGEQVKVYPAEPQVDDRYDRGSLTGRRQVSVTYLFTGEGRVQLPDIVIPWWDTANQQMQRAVLAGREVEIAAAPGGEAAGATRSDSGQLSKAPLSRWLQLAGIVLAAVSAAALFFRKQIDSGWTRRRQARRASEQYQFRKFRQAARDDDLAASANRLMAWLDRTHPTAGAARLDLFIDQFGDDAAREAARRFTSALSGAQSGWRGKTLAKTMTAARRRWKASLKENERRIERLPALNP